MAGVKGQQGGGGARIGAGRKPKFERFATAIQRAEKRIADRLPELIDTLFELSEGITVREFDAKGEAKIYDRPPDFRAAAYLVDRVLGKPTQAVDAEVSGSGGGAIRIKVEYADAGLHDHPAEAPSGAAADTA